MTLYQCVDIDATVSSTNVTCNGDDDGSISITDPLGGTSPYEYSIDGGTTWVSSGTFTALAPATYNVRIKDANDCETVLDADLVITEPAQLSLTSALVTTEIECFGDEATVTFIAAGGTAPISYTFNNQTNETGIFTGISAGEDLPYSITDANSCGPVTGTITVIVNDDVDPVFTECPTEPVDLGCNPTALPDASMAIVAAGDVTDNCSVA